MKRILVPTDFSKNAEVATDYALKLAEATGAKVLLCNAYSLPSTSAQMLGNMVEILQKRSQEELTDLKKDLISKYEIDSEKISTHPILGDVLEAMNTMVDKEDVDLIVMGTTGAGSFINKLFGSNAANALRHAKRPVLTIPPNMRFAKPKKICLATDFKMKSSNVLDMMIDIAKLYESHIDVLYVNDDKSDLPEAEQVKKSEEMDGMLQGVSHDFHFVDNNRIEDGINSFVDEHQHEMLCMIIKNYGFLESLFHRSVTKEMAMSGKVPLLALK